MMENVLQFVEDYLPQFMGVGLAFGWFIGFVLSLVGYSVGKVLSMIGSQK